MRTFLLCATALALSLATFGCGGGGGSSSGSSSSGGGTSSSGGASSSSGGGTSSSSGGGTSSSSGGGTSSSGGTVTDTTPPSLTNPGLSATSLDFRGGPVTISVQVTDPSGILSVVATVQKTDGGAGGDVSLAAVGGNTYSGQYSIPANQHTDGRSDTYTVSVKATDAVGNTSPTYAAGTVTVGPPDADDPVPPPPSFDTLPPAF